MTSLLFPTYDGNFDMISHKGNDGFFHTIPKVEITRVVIYYQKKYSAYQKLTNDLDEIENLEEKLNYVFRILFMHSDRYF